MAEDILYAALYERDTGEVKEIIPRGIVDHIRNGYKVISKELAEKLRPRAKGLHSLASQ